MSDDAKPAFTFDVKPAEGGKVEVVVQNPDGAVLVRDTVDPRNARSRSRVLDQVPTRCAGATEDFTSAIESALMSASSAGARPTEREGSRSQAQLAAERDEEIDRLLGQMDDGIVKEAQDLLDAPDLMGRIYADLQSLGVVGEQPLCCQVYLIFTSRLSSSPLAGLVQGTSSSGKSFVPETIARLMPPEAVLMATDLTANALYYTGEEELVHRAVVAGERARRQVDEQAEATRALREMISSGVLRKVVPEKDSTGRLQTRVIERHGPIAFIESTTQTKVFDEDANRMLLLGTDETSAQTARILGEMGARAAGARDRGQVQRLQLVHHALQRLLRRVEVVVPFAELVMRAIPVDRPDARRAAGHILAVIRASALLHQRQRATGGVQHGTRVQAILQDYELARGLLEGPLGRALGGDLPEAVARFAVRLREEFGDRVFTSNEAHQRDPVLKAKSKVNEYLRALADAGPAELVDQGKGPHPSAYRMVSDVPAAGARWLPAVGDVAGAMAAQVAGSQVS